MSMRINLRNIFGNTRGSVMMEYVVITSVIALGAAGFVYADGHFVSLLGGGLKGSAGSPFYINDKTFEYSSVPEAERSCT